MRKYTETTRIFFKKVSHIFTMQNKCRCNKDKRPEVGTVALVTAYCKTQRPAAQLARDGSIYLALQTKRQLGLDRTTLASNNANQTHCSCLAAGS